MIQVIQEMEEIRMRDDIRSAVDAIGSTQHAGLQYDMLAPVSVAGEKPGQVPDNRRESWFQQLESIQIHNDYKVAYDRWKESLRSLQATVVEVASLSRLLIGHGNPSAAEVGLTVHHTWGTPIIPGSSLKGLLHHYLVDKYGPDPEHWSYHPLAKDHPETERSPFQPVKWNNKSIVHSPGVAIRTLFGAPDADSDDNLSWRGDANVGAAKGSLCFLDAWWKPEDLQNKGKPFASDILNVHQRTYYKQMGGPRDWPNDYDDPNPVHFLTIKPQQKFLLAIVGEKELAQWALQELQEALLERGVGSKTSLGYGVLETRGQATSLVEVKESPVLQEFIEIVLQTKNPPDIEDPTAKQVIEYVENELLDAVCELSEEQRQEAAAKLKQSKLAKNKNEKIRAMIARIIESLTSNA